MPFALGKSTKNFEYVFLVINSFFSRLLSSKYSVHSILAAIIYQYLLDFNLQICSALYVLFFHAGNVNAVLMSLKELKGNVAK